MRETLSLAELFALFERSGDAARSLGLADSIEYLNVVLWIFDRNQKEMIKK